MKNVDLLILYIGGWFDIYLWGIIYLYKEMVGWSKFL